MNDSDFNEYAQMCDVLTSAQLPQERTKAESMLIAFLKNVENFQKLQFFASNTDSDSVLFVTCELLYKIVRQTRLELIPTVVNDMLENQPNANTSTINHFTQLFELFIKVLLDKSGKLKVFTINSIANLIGCIIKKIWLDIKPDEGKTLIETIKTFFLVQNNPTLENIGLRVYEQIVFNINYFDQTDSYLTHRKVTVAFQKEPLLIILETVLELLYKDLPQIKSQTIDLNIGVQNLVQAFKVIFQCTTFSFSFNYFDIDLDYDSTDVPFVNFPEGWNKIICSPEVYELFYLSYLLLSSYSETESLLVLRSLNRLISSRLTIFENKDQTKEFRRGMFQAVFNFSKTVYQKCNEQILIELIEGNIRYLTNIGARRARKQANFEEWFEVLKDISILGFQIGANIANPIPTKLFDLWRRFLRQVATDQRMVFYVEKAEAYAFEVMSRFLDGIVSNSDQFFFEFQYDNSKKFRKQITSYFNLIYDLFAVKFKENLQNVNTVFSSLLLKYNDILNNVDTSTSQNSFFNQLSVIFAIIISTHLTSSNIEKKGLPDGPSEEMNYEGLNLANCFKVIQTTLDLQQNGKWISNRTFELITILFMESYITVTIDGLYAFKDTGGISQSNSKIHQITSNCIGTDDYSKTVELFVTKLCTNLQYPDNHLLSYSLYLMKIIIIKLKSNSKRETFKELNVLGILLKQLEQFNKSALFEKKFYNFRKKAYEIIAIAWLDDYFDSFLDTIDKISSIIYQTNFPDNNITADNLIRFFKDSSGIVGYLDVSKIFKYYFKTTFPLYLDLIENQLPAYVDNLDVLAAFLDFYCALSQNQSSRLSSDPNSQLGYQIFMAFEKFIENTQGKLQSLVFELKQTQDYESNYDKMKVIGKVLKVFNIFIKSKYINFSVFQIFENEKFLVYLKLNMDLGGACFEIFQYFPKFFELFIDNVYCLCDMFMEIILTYLDPEYAYNMLRFAFETIRMVQEEKFGNIELKFFHDDILLGKCRSIIYQTCSFIYEEYNLKVASKMKDNIERCLNMCFDIIKANFKSILELLFFSNKTNHVKSIYSSILYALIITNEKIFTEVLQEFLMGIAGTEDQYNTFANIFNESFTRVERKFDSLNFDKFANNLKNSINSITSILLEGKPRDLTLFNI